MNQTKFGVIFMLVFSYCSNLHIERKLPKGLAIATASSAYQVEGAWNEDGKGESIWDRMTHEHPERIVGGSNGDIACDSYHRIKEDVALIKNVGFQQYRFSISWPRILPQGYANIVNNAGIQYYNKLIDELIANEITPIVTLYHWDLPQVLQDLGGWANSLIVDWIEDYARIVFKNFGDRVKLWITINEPKVICYLGYGYGLELNLAPGVHSRGIGEYLCARNVLLAHARIFHLYKNLFYRKQKGRISITIECPWKEPASNSSEDIAAADRDIQFDYGIYAHPIFTEKGDFPSVVQEAVAARSAVEGFSQSRFPVLSKKEVQYIRGTYDFFGLNYYTTRYTTSKVFPIGSPSSVKDSGIQNIVDPNWLHGTFDYFYSVPWGFRKMLNYIKNNYGNPDIIITEAGYPDSDQFNDINTIKHHNSHLNALLDAIQFDGVKVKTYTVWTLMDNFEWVSGYSVWFGVYHVDFQNPNRTRTPKLSHQYFKRLMSSRTLSRELHF